MREKGGGRGKMATSAPAKLIYQRLRSRQREKSSLRASDMFVD